MTRLPTAAGALCLMALFAGATPAASLPEQAEALVYQGKAVEAHRLLGKALEAAQARRDPREERDALAGRGFLFLALGESDKARSLLEPALALAEKQGEPGPHARVLNYLARFDLLRTRYGSAEARLERALDLAVRSGDPKVRGETLRLLCELRRRQGQLPAAEQRMSEALVLAEGAGDAAGAAFVVAQRAHLQVQRAALGAALADWEEARNRFRGLGYLVPEADAIINLGEVQFELGLVAESTAQFQEGLKRARSLADPAAEVRALTRLGRAHLRLKEPDRTLDYAEGALAIARKRHDYVGEAEALTQLGELWLGDPLPRLPAVPNPEVALRHLKSATEVYRDAGDRAGEGRAYLKVGVANLMAERPRVAARVFEVVSEGARQTGDDDTLWQALRGEAKALAMVGDLAGAAQRYREAIEVLERVYAGTAGLEAEVRSAFLGDKRGLYEDYVEVLIRLGPGAAGPDPAAEAFAVSELARSRQFAEMVSGAGAERAAARAEPRLRELAERERALRIELGQLRRALSGPGGAAPEAQALRQRAAELSAAHDAARRRLAEEFPRYSELTRPKRVGVAEVQAVLGPDEALLSYFAARWGVIAFVVTAKEFTLIRLELSRTELRRLVDRFRGPFTEIRSVGDLLKWKPDSARELYRMLVAPLAARLPAKGTLFVAGDDALYTLPFEALLRSDIAPRPPAPGKSPRFSEFAAADWLGDRYAIAYLPSAGVLQSLRGGAAARRGWPRSLVAFADPDFGDGDAAAGGIATKGVAGALLSRATGVTGLPRLKETADEAAAVAGMLGGEPRVFLRRDASERRVQELDLQGTRYLMFSTHGLLGGDFSGVAEPALVLSLVGNPAGVDGFLTMSEVLGLRLDAELTVLSACNTAGEPEHARGGEGFAGLTRSFMYAGTSALLVSHWPVGSEATVVLVSELFRQLAAAHPKPVALARARRALRETVQGGVQFAHPFFWAPFVLVGEPR